MKFKGLLTLLFIGILTFFVSCNTNYQNGLEYKWNAEYNGWMVIGSADPNLKELVIPERILETRDKVIGVADNAFENSKITSVVFSDSVKYIGKSAFKNSDLTELVDLKNVEIIESEAFDSVKIPKYIIPKTVKKIGKNAFNASDDLKNIVEIEVKAEEKNDTKTPMTSGVVYDDGWFGNLDPNNVTFEGAKLNDFVVDQIPAVFKGSPIDLLSLLNPNPDRFIIKKDMVSINPDDYLTYDKNTGKLVFKADSNGVKQINITVTPRVGTPITKVVDVVAKYLENPTNYKIDIPKNVTKGTKEEIKITKDPNVDPNTPINVEILDPNKSKAEVEITGTAPNQKFFIKALEKGTDVKVKVKYGNTGKTEPITIGYPGAKISSVKVDNSPYIIGESYEFSYKTDENADPNINLEFVVAKDGKIYEEGTDYTIIRTKDALTHETKFDVVFKDRLKGVDYTVYAKEENKDNTSDKKTNVEIKYTDVNSLEIAGEDNLINNNKYTFVAIIDPNNKNVGSISWNFDFAKFKCDGPKDQKVIILEAIENTNFSEKTTINVTVNGNTITTKEKEVKISDGFDLGVNYKKDGAILGEELELNEVGDTEFKANLVKIGTNVPSSLSTDLVYSIQPNVPNISIDQDGNITIKEGYIPENGKTEIVVRIEKKDPNPENIVASASIILKSPEPKTFNLDGKSSIVYGENQEFEEYNYSVLPKNAYVDESNLSLKESDYFEIKNLSIRAKKYSDVKQDLVLLYNGKKVATKTIKINYSETEGIGIEEDHTKVIDNHPLTYTARVKPRNYTEPVKWSLSSGADNYVELIDNKDGTCTLSYLKNGGTNIELKATSGALSDTVKDIITRNKYNTVIEFDGKKVNTIKQNETGDTKVSLTTTSDETNDIDQNKVIYTIEKPIPTGVSIVDNKLVISKDFEGPTSDIKIIGIYDGDPSKNSEKIVHLEKSKYIRNIRIVAVDKSKNEMPLILDGNRKFTYEIEPENAYLNPDDVTFEENSSNIEIISTKTKNNKKIVVVKALTYNDRPQTLVATYKGNNFTKDIVLEYQETTSIVLSPDSINILPINEDEVISATILPNLTFTKPITWVKSNTLLAKFNESDNKINIGDNDNPNDSGEFTVKAIVENSDGKVIESNIVTVKTKQLVINTNDNIKLIDENDFTTPALKVNVKNELGISVDQRNLTYEIANKNEFGPSAFINSEKKIVINGSLFKPKSKNTSLVINAIYKNKVVATKTINVIAPDVITTNFTLTGPNKLTLGAVGKSYTVSYHPSTAFVDPSKLSFKDSAYFEFDGLNVKAIKSSNTKQKLELLYDGKETNKSIDIAIDYEKTKAIAVSGTKNVVKDHSIKYTAIVTPKENTKPVTWSITASSGNANDYVTLVDNKNGTCNLEYKAITPLGVTLTVKAESNGVTDKVENIITSDSYLIDIVLTNSDGKEVGNIANRNDKGTTEFTLSSRSNDPALVITEANMVYTIKAPIPTGVSINGNKLIITKDFKGDASDIEIISQDKKIPKNKITESVVINSPKLKNIILERIGGNTEPLLLGKNAKFTYTVEPENAFVYSDLVKYSKKSNHFEIVGTEILDDKMVVEVKGLSFDRNPQVITLNYNGKSYTTEFSLDYQKIKNIILTSVNGILNAVPGYPVVINATIDPNNGLTKPIVWNKENNRGAIFDEKTNQIIVNYDSNGSVDITASSDSITSNKLTVTTNELEINVSDLNNGKLLLERIGTTRKDITVGVKSGAIVIDQSKIKIKLESPITGVSIDSDNKIVIDSSKFKPTDKETEITLIATDPTKPGFKAKKTFTLVTPDIVGMYIKEVTQKRLTYGKQSLSYSVRIEPENAFYNENDIVWTVSDDLKIEGSDRGSSVYVKVKNYSDKKQTIKATYKNISSFELNNNVIIEYWPIDSITPSATNIDVYPGYPENIKLTIVPDNKYTAPIEFVTTDLNSVNTQILNNEIEIAYKRKSSAKETLRYTVPKQPSSSANVDGNISVETNNFEIITSTNVLQNNNGNTLSPYRIGNTGSIVINDNDVSYDLKENIPGITLEKDGTRMVIKVDGREFKPTSKKTTITLRAKSSKSGFITIEKEIEITAPDLAKLIIDDSNPKELFYGKPAKEFSYRVEPENAFFDKSKVEFETTSAFIIDKNKLKVVDNWDGINTGQYIVAVFDGVRSNEYKITPKYQETEELSITNNNITISEDPNYDYEINVFGDPGNQILDINAINAYCEPPVVKRLTPTEEDINPFYVNRDSKSIKEKFRYNIQEPNSEFIVTSGKITNKIKVNFIELIAFAEGGNNQLLPTPDNSNPFTIKNVNGNSYYKSTYGSNGTLPLTKPLPTEDNSSVVVSLWLTQYPKSQKWWYSILTSFGDYGFGILNEDNNNGKYLGFSSNNGRDFVGTQLDGSYYSDTLLGNTFHHVCVELVQYPDNYNGSVFGLNKIYIDGNKKELVNYSDYNFSGEYGKLINPSYNHTKFTTNKKAYIGYAIGKNNHYLTGAYDNFRVYKGSLGSTVKQARENVARIRELDLSGHR